MDFIMIPLVMGIITLGIYKLFELIIGRRERRMIIEKMEAASLLDYIQLTQTGLCAGTVARPAQGFSSGALRIGCLLMGLGVGMLVGFLLLSQVGLQNDYRMESIVFGGSVLFFGGLGLIVAFVVERLLTRKQA